METLENAKAVTQEPIKPSAESTLSITVKEPLEDASTVSSRPEIVVTAGFSRQLHYLLVREVQGTIRNKGALIGRFGVTIFLNILFSLIFLGAGHNDDSNNSNFQSHFGAVTMVTISTMFGNAAPVILSFPFERPMFMREYCTGTYETSPYFIAKVIYFLQCTIHAIKCNV
jgi:hypothetical protein